MTPETIAPKPSRSSRFGVARGLAAASAAALVLLGAAPPAEAGGRTTTAGPRGGSVSSHGSHGSGGRSSYSPSHRGGSRNRHPGTGGSYRHRRYGWWGPSWSSWYGYRYGYYGWGWPTTIVVSGGHFPGSRWAAVDTDVAPEEAELWLDGVFIGTADDFDGHPDLLYLRPGRYALELKLKGYVSVTKTLDVRAGRLVRLNDELERAPGGSKWDSWDADSKRGTPLGRFFGPKATPLRPDAREARERERDADDDRIEPDDIDAEDLEGDDDEVGPSRDRTGRWDDADAPRRRSDVRIEDRGKAEGSEKADGGEAGKTPAPTGEIRTGFRFIVTPSDAAVYLDDRYVGTGADLRRRGGPVEVEIGKREVVVQRPGYASKKVTIEAKAGAPVDVIVELTKD